MTLPVIVQALVPKCSTEMKVLPVGRAANTDVRLLIL